MASAIYGQMTCRRGMNMKSQRFVRNAMRNDERTSDRMRFSVSGSILFSARIAALRSSLRMRAMMIMSKFWAPLQQAS